MFEDPLGERIPISEVALPITGMTEVEAIRQVLALRPVTEQIVRTLHPTRTLAEVLDFLDSTGYPRK
ncbi:hypothetical protein CU044_3391 [Streptomyces sp. L-9-10]|nr:hypothetical protein CU044_3391 [Streptomyces sp. L-9-10]